MTVLFADLVGFTPFAEERDAEEVRDTLSRYFEVASEIVGRYGGAVEKFIGDAVMAVWGAPTAHEDDAERAVRAGLELVDAVRQLGDGIQARAGVLTGEAAVTLGATNQGLVAGDLVNTASRLQAVAPPGSVLCGDATQRAASKAIVFERAGEQLLKGKQSVVPSWRALRVVAEVGGRNRSEALEAPFVGRDDELRLLKDLFHATTREQRARLVSVLGPAGIGKSRLAWEFLKYVDGLVEGVWWHDGRSPAYGDGITFWALGEMVRARAGLLETDDEQTTRSRITAALAEHVPDEAERRWLEPPLLTLLGIETGIPSEQLFPAWRAFFARLAATAPVVMVFEDFHYADSGLLDFVDELLEWSRDAPIYVLTLARPELIDRRPDWGARRRSFTAIHLDPLAEADMHELLLGLVPGLPASAVTAIAGRADGIPLYAVETVRMLLAAGDLTLEGDAYVPAGDLTTLAVPETLTALIAARLDGLPPQDRALVEDAAVLGQSFTPAALAAVTALEPDRMEPGLRSLVRREVLRLEADPRSPERGQYAFVQALIREVAYNTLAKPDRKTRHLAAARFFESLGSEELAGALAGHYLAAYHNAPRGPEAEALQTQARIALNAAADRATGLGSFDQAVVFLTAAMEVTTDAADLASSWRAAAAAAESAADMGTAERYVRQAVDWYRGQRDLGAMASASAQLGRVLVSSSRLEPAMLVMRQALAEAGGAAGAAAEAELHAQLARALMLHDEDEPAIQEAELALRAAAPLDLLPVLTDALVTKGTAMLNSTRAREGVVVLTGALDLATRSGLVATELRAINNLANALFYDDRAEGYRLTLEGIERARKLGQREWELALARVCGVLGLEAGGWDDTLAMLDELEKGPVEADIAVAFAHLRGRIALYRGDADETDRQAERSAELLIGLSSPTTLGFDQNFHAERALWAGDHARAYEMALLAYSTSAEVRAFSADLAARAAAGANDVAGVEKALGLLAQVGVHGAWVDAVNETWNTAVLAMTHRERDAHAAFRRALSQWHKLELRWLEALATIDLVPLLDSMDPEIQAAVASARETLTRLRAKPSLDLLEAAMARAAAGHSDHEPPPSAPVASEAAATS